MRSSRLPGKVLFSLHGKPMLAMQIERIKQSKMLNDIVLATGKDIADDLLSSFAQEYNVKFFRGSSHNVLDRYYGAAQQFKATTIVRITGDCPLIDPQVIDDIINAYFDSQCDYVSNTLEPTFPDGLDVEVFSMEALKYMYQRARLPSELEHVTQYVFNHKNSLKIKNYAHTDNLSHLRWTVDELDDFVFISKVYDALYTKNRLFGFKDILDLLSRQPELQKINQGFLRNEGLARSIKEDVIFLERGE
jgi:spore coat polysaccharide biosynthesis protein SpsF